MMRFLYSLLVIVPVVIVPVTWVVGSQPMSLVLSSCELAGRGGVDRRSSHISSRGACPGRSTGNPFRADTSCGQVVMGHSGKGYRPCEGADDTEGRTPVHATPPPDLRRVSVRCGEPGQRRADTRIDRKDFRERSFWVDSDPPLRVRRRQAFARTS